VRNAVEVWIANIVVGLVSSALTYTLTDPYATMQRQIQRSSRPGYTPSKRTHSSLRWWS